jgi:hypothetical protein
MYRNLLVAAAALVALSEFVLANTVQIPGPGTSPFGPTLFLVGDSTASNTLALIDSLNVSFTQRDTLATLSSNGGLSLEFQLFRHTDLSALGLFRSGQQITFPSS